LAVQLYRNPETGSTRALLIMGLDPSRRDFRAVTTEQMTALYRDDVILFDELSRPEFGPRQVGVKTEAAGRAVTIVGLFRVGTGFGADGTVVCNEATFASMFAPRTVDDITLGLIRLEPGTDANEVAGRLRAMLPQDVVVKTRAEFLAAEQHYWIVKTSVGVIFGLGVAVAFLVGAAIVYQVLSADIANRLPEFATLKAMGYSKAYLTRVVLVQAAIIGVVGFVPGWLVSSALFAVTRNQAHLPMEMGVLLPPVVLALSIVMCGLSGLVALRKVHQVDPADLFV
jgi:putative ABC transport system permease protein